MNSYRGFDLYKVYIFVGFFLKKHCYITNSKEQKELIWIFLSWHIAELAKLQDLKAQYPRLVTPVASLRDSQTTFN
jgi:hypothetical protein